MSYYCVLLYYYVSKSFFGPSVLSTSLNLFKLDEIVNTSLEVKTGKIKKVLLIVKGIFCGVDN